MKVTKKSTIEVGNIYGFWKVLKKPLPGRETTKVTCICVGCDQTIKDIYYIKLLAGTHKSCGCQAILLRKSTCLERFGVEYPSRSSEIQAKTITTNLEKFGVEHPAQCEYVRQKMHTTHLDRTGYEFALQNPDSHAKYEKTTKDRLGVPNPSLSDEIKEKKKRSSLKKYGVDNPRKARVVKKKIKQTMFDRYGVESPMQSEEIRERGRQTNLDKYGVEHVAQLPENRYKLRDWCEENPHLLFQSTPELEILSFVQEYYPSACKLKQEGYELDIFIPELNIGIEHNGLYRHSESFKTKNYHLEKTNYFKSKGIRVIHIWGHEWQRRKRQVGSFLLSAINKNEHKIGAKRCRFIWSSDKETIKKAQELLENTHIQGRAHSVKYVVNAYYEDTLIATATFGLHHRNSKQYVLSRFTTKTNYTIQGCLSKISKLAYENLQVPIISWADYRLSTGNGYLKAGWKYEELLRPDYFYYKNGDTIISKQSRQKKVVGTPKGMTEREHAELDGLVRVYDCGKIRFTYEGEGH